MKNNFETIFPLLIKDEGGYGNDPADAGGPTKYGITIDDVQKYIKKGATADDVRALTLDQAKTIYRDKYWNALDCDNLTSGVDYTVFDYGVNSGLGRPRNCLKKFADKKGDELIDAINDERMSFLKGLVDRKPSQSKFLKGWTNRVTRVRSKSHDLAKKNNIAGPVGGTATVGLGVSLSQYFHQHQTAIIIGTVVFAFLVGAGIHWYNNRGK